MNVIQIGTNNGADEFQVMCSRLHPKKIILVEPLTKFNPHIEANYKHLKNVFLENVAITKKEMGIVTLVIPRDRPEMWGYQNFSLLPMDDWGRDFHKIKSPSMTFTQLCKKHNITNIDYLQIDTEGYDAEIIKSIDFNKIHIGIIRYEKWKFSPDCFTRHGKKGKQYGTAGMEYVANLLKVQGYDLQEELEDIVAIKKLRL